MRGERGAERGGAVTRIWRSYMKEYIRVPLAKLVGEYCKLALRYPLKAQSSQRLWAPASVWSSKELGV